jgi:hypothetical protein
MCCWQRFPKSSRTVSSASPQSGGCRLKSHPLRGTSPFLRRRLTIEVLESRRLLADGANLPFDDSGLAPPGLEATCALPNLPVFNVTTFGARGDGVTDDTLAIRAAISVAVAQGGGIIYLPAGNYAVCPQSSDPSPYGSVFTISSSNLVFIGDGADRSHLQGYCLGMLDPVANWTVISSTAYSKIGRFNMFGVDSTHVSLSTLQFRSLEINGNAGWTGNSTVGGVPSTGDGWDITHKCIQMTGSKAIDAVLVFNCTLDNWRGEIVYAGGDNPGKISIVNSHIYGTNGSAISCSANTLISNTTVGGNTAGSDVYNGVENFCMGAPEQLVIQDSTFSCSSNPASLHGNGVVYLGLNTSSLLIERSAFVNNTFGIMFYAFGYNMTIQGNAFSNNGHAMITATAGHEAYPYPVGFGNVTISGNTFDHSGGAFYSQAYWHESFSNLLIRNNIVTNGSLLQGAFNGPSPSSWIGFNVDGNTLGVGARDVGNFQGGNNIALWTNTIRTNPTSSGMQVYDYSRTSGPVSVCPASDLVILGDNQTAGDLYVAIDPTAQRHADSSLPAYTLDIYPVGFSVTFIAPLKRNWVLKADPTWNTLASDQPVGSDGVSMVKNAQGLFTLVNVVPTLSKVVISPGDVTLSENQCQQFTATGYDSDGNALASQPAFTWALASGAGSIDAGGLYTAPAANGSAIITATSGLIHGSATVTVNSFPTAVIGNSGPISEGSLATVSLSNPYDPSSADTAAGFHYSFATSQGGLAATYASTGEASAASFQFVDEGTYTLWGRIFDVNNGYTDYQTQVEVNDVPPAINAGPDITAEAGNAFTQAGTFVDPGADSPWQVYVNYTYDPSEDCGLGLLVQSGSNKGFELSHTYAATGTYTVRVTVIDDRGTAGTDDLVVTVVPGSFHVLSFVPNASGFDVTFNRAANPGLLNLYDGVDFASCRNDLRGASDMTVVGATSGAIRGSLVWDAAASTAHFIKTGGILAPDAYTVTLFSRADGWVDASGNLLDGDLNGVAGGDCERSFTVAPFNDRVLSLPDFARGPTQPINVFANGTAGRFASDETTPIYASGLPISISDGMGVTSVDFTLVYDPAVLDITGVAPGLGVPENGWSLAWSQPFAGGLHVMLSGNGALASGTQPLIVLAANVPVSAPYGAVEVLRFTDVQVNGGLIAARGDEAIHEAVYFGDASGEGYVGGEDAAAVARVVVASDSGFYGAPLVDPIIVGGVGGDGGLSSYDAALLSQDSVGLVVPQIPDPGPAPSILARMGATAPISNSRPTSREGDTLHRPVRITDNAARLLSADVAISCSSNARFSADADARLSKSPVVAPWDNAASASSAAGAGPMTDFSMGGPAREEVPCLLNQAFRVPEAAKAGTLARASRDHLNGGHLRMTPVSSRVTIAPQHFVGPGPISTLLSNWAWSSSAGSCLATPGRECTEVWHAAWDAALMRVLVAGDDRSRRRLALWD